MAPRMTKSSRRDDKRPSSGVTEQPVKSPGHDTATPAVNGSPPSDIRSRIEKLAYQLYERRGCRHGDDWKDWLEAERLTIDTTKR
jgi:hypothetical protein